MTPGLLHSKGSEAPNANALLVSGMASHSATMTGVGSPGSSGTSAVSGLAGMSARSLDGPVTSLGGVGVDQQRLEPYFQSPRSRCPPVGQAMTDEAIGVRTPIERFAVVRCALGKNGCGAANHGIGISIWVFPGPALGLEGGVAAWGQRCCCPCLTFSRLACRSTSGMGTKQSPFAE